MFSRSFPRCTPKNGQVTATDEGFFQCVSEFFRNSDSEPFPSEMPVEISKNICDTPLVDAKARKGLRQKKKKQERINASISVICDISTKKVSVKP